MTEKLSRVGKFVAGAWASRMRYELADLRRKKPRSALILGMREVIALLESHAQTHRGVRSSVDPGLVMSAVRFMEKGRGHYEAAKDAIAMRAVSEKIKRARNPEAQARLMSPERYDIEFERARADIQDEHRTLARAAKKAYAARVEAEMAELRRN